MTHKRIDPDSARSRDLLDGFVGRLEALGFGADVRHDPETAQSDAAVFLGGRPVARVEISVFDGRFTLNVKPADPSEITLLCQSRGRLHVAEESFVTDALDEPEALFRTVLVREGRLPEPEFATDYALRRWVAAGSTIRLPHERAPRRYLSEGVMFMPDELPGDSDRSSSPASKALVQACRLLDVEFERERALEVARAAAAAPVEGGSDKALSYLAYSARRLLRGRMRDMEIALDKGGLNRMLALHWAERDDVRVPLSVAEEVSAPRLW